LQVAKEQGEIMGTTALPQSVNYSQGHLETADTTGPDWARMAVGGALLTGAILLLSGKRRAGLVVSAAATALTLLDEEDTLRRWWNALPRYLDDAQQLLDQAQHTIEDLTQKRDKLRAMFNK
jgi:hypothetical protein